MVRVFEAEGVGEMKGKNTLAIGGYMFCWWLAVFSALMLTSHPVPVGTPIQTLSEQITENAIMATIPSVIVGVALFITSRPNHRKERRKKQ